MANYNELKQTKEFLNGIFKIKIESMIKSGIDKDTAISYIQDIAETHRQEKIFVNRGK